MHEAYTNFNKTKKKEMAKNAQHTIDNDVAVI